MAKKIIAPFVLVLIIIGMVYLLVKSYRQPHQTVQSDKLQIVASFYPLYFFSQQISGDEADVINIVPAGAEPHDYEPTAQDIAKMERSKIIVLNGGGLESWGNDIQKNIDAKKTTIVVAGEGLATQQVKEDGKIGTDPHIWLAPPLAQKMVDKITEGFKQVDPKNKDYYQSNANALKIKLGELDMKYKQGLNNCSEKNIITSHNAFGYLASIYGLNQVPITGLSPDAEPSSQQLAAIVKFAKDNHVKYIFFESLVSPKLSETLAAEVGAQTLVLNTIEGLSDEELAEGKNYFSVMQDNLTNLQIALQCNT